MAPKQSNPAVGHGSSTPQSGRTNNRNRQPSREALEAIATEADVRDVMGGSSSGQHVSTPLTSGTGASLSNVTSSSSSSSPSGNGLALLSQLSQSDIHDLMTAVAQLRVSPPSSSSSSSSPSSSSSAAEKKVHRTTTNGGASTPSVSVHPPPIINSRVPSVVPTGGNVDIDPLDISDDETGLTKPPRTADSDGGDDDDLVWDMMVIPASERMAANAIALCQRDHGTFRRRAMDKKCSDRRNAREIDALSLIFDALIANRSDVAMELIARRMVGIEEADSSGNWHIADAIQVMRTGSLMSEQHRRHFVKVAKLLDKDKKDSTSGGHGSSKRSVPRATTKRAARDRRIKTKQSSSNTASGTTSTAGKD